MSKVSDPIDVAMRAVTVALKLGAGGADAFVRTANDLSIELRNGEVESVNRATTFGLGLRAQVDGRTVLVHTTNSGGIALMKLVQTAVEMARALPEGSEPTPFAEPAEAPELPHPDPGLQEEPHDAKVSRLRTAEQVMLGVSGVTASGGVGYGESDGWIALANSHGLKRSTPFCSIEMGAEAIAEKGGDTASGGRWCSAPGRPHLLDPEALGRDAGRQAAERLGARPVASTRVPVIFTPHVGWAVLAYVSLPVRGDHVVRERSYLAGRIGETIAASSITIIDDPLRAGGAGRRPFDGEGTPCRTLPIVENGVLTNYLTDLSSAEKLGVAPGGNTWRGSYTSAPEIGTSTFYMQAGATPPEEIIRRTPKGLLLTGLSGWWVGLSPVTDTFSSAAMGFWIENGEIAHPVKGVSVGSTLREMLGSIDLVGNDLRFTHENNTPTFRVAEMAVSGT